MENRFEHADALAAWNWGGEVAGAGVAIEKSMREGGRVLRRMGIRVEALATVQAIEHGQIILA